jgi:phage baseplate assembly protein W
MQICFPFRIDSSGKVETTSQSAHVVEMIEQVLFTVPGERVNRPDFGCGIAQMVFENESTETDTVIQVMVQGALQQWLGDVIQLESVDVTTDDSELTIQIQYLLRSTRERKISKFIRQVGGSNL